jgi:hypothetical protein
MTISKTYLVMRQLAQVMATSTTTAKMMATSTFLIFFASETISK